MLYTQEGILDDKVSSEREQGIKAGLRWGECAEVSVVYIDRGIGEGMLKGIKRAKECSRPVEYRSLYEKVAFIESVVTDQGNGGSYCSHCRHNIDIQKIGELDHCPGCKRKLIWGETSINRGGSDF
ncbi:MAG: hypothetical protein A2942_02500 [Candidatus Lloydbacteria bacterium RIFCSPLOWO2_01_FULL_50_20]|uniref:DUF7768 domain-containing protein n=1 Tax=Candidatus Lloydbacteria bacterium RIFCSPLOWO2_01_FULL_50_20 TaxID=1798665 RepID=A0A1G2DET3_9BACT|nr:MAG: hypothetical protein A3C13_01845 [Candidatus Lloydbacteria bacterium RIFCSPHIGHO2_02_FULL_50_11]OGZ12119.1 MAG: hypothetical protein A2942_02500 [Candidatus Lloydbacteria bacterium RIFCSPLOWO2_01_FULL_50_20]